MQIRKRDRLAVALIVIGSLIGVFSAVREVIAWQDIWLYGIAISASMLITGGLILATRHRKC